MKKLFCLILMIAVLCAGLPGAWGTDSALPAVSCQAYIIMDAETGQVLIEHKADQRLYPASITKIMTLGLAAQKANGNWDQVLTVNEESVVSLYGTESTHMSLQPGEEIRLEDVMYGTQLASANDGANVLACYVGGSITGGVEMMNRCVEELGLKNTHFANPHGLMDTNHYTSARDMAEITRWALKQPGFETVFTRTDTWFIEPTNMQPEQRMFGSSDWMKVGVQKYREYALGSKSGFHDQAGQTLVTLCEQDGMRLIGVLLNDVSKAEKFGDACKLMDYCFDKFRKVEIEAEDYSVPVPVKAGGDVLGEAKAHAVKAYADLHVNNSEGNVTVEYRLPEVYVVGLQREPEQVLHIQGGGWQSDSEAVFSMTYTGVAEVLRNNVKAPEKTNHNEDIGHYLGRAGKIAAILALLAIVICLLKRGKRKSRQRAKSMNEEQLINHRWLPADNAPRIINPAKPAQKQVYRRPNKTNSGRR